MSPQTILPDLRPGISNVRAIVTTRWKGSAYKPLVIPQLESYYIDTALDTDADTWSVDIGDPTGEFMETLERDNEVRVQLFGVGTEGTAYILTGISDDVTYDEEGVLTISGRDMSSLAVDSTCPPLQLKHVRAWAVVAQQAKEIGFRKTRLAEKGIIKKRQFTDGSESYWEFWYRLYRREKMWIWTEPDGTLVAGNLNYNGQNAYYFGTPHQSDSDRLKRVYIPIERCEIRKSTQNRLFEVWVYGHKGDNGFMKPVKDGSISNWIKKPRKIMLDTESHTTAGATKMGLEEIFESKVGAREITITIPDPGFMIKQNMNAHVNIPEIGFEGDYFIVGVRAQGNSSGFVQEIRLREKQYAITKRVPTDPKPTAGGGPSKTGTVSALGPGIAALADMPEAWGSYFVKAAKDFHGPWDYNLFLATLLGICQKETGFQNERENGGPGGDHHEWSAPPSGVAKPTQGPTVIPGSENPFGPGVKVPAKTGPNPLEVWRTQFANESGDGYVSKEFGVGPMQLTTRNLKHDADDHFKVGNRDEFVGGRWHPEHNIYIAASNLRSCLKQTVGDSGRDIDMWEGVDAYNHGVAGAQAYLVANGHPSSYALTVKNYVYNDPGFLANVKAAVKAAQEAAKTDSGNPYGTSPNPNDPNFGPLGANFAYGSTKDDTGIKGFPGEGTHSWTDPPNNWQSDNAIDIYCKFGTPVYAVTEGIVGNWGVLPGSGFAIVQQPGDTGDRFAGNRVNIESAKQSCYYAHLSSLSPLVQRTGAKVKVGDLLGYSGVANGVKHLHFAVEKGSPFNYIPGGDPRQV